jgi:protein-S-isoprenylcysteine O-methyltransferase Ste14
MLMMVMNPWYGRLAVFMSLLAFVIIRWPHGNRYKTFKAVQDRKGRLEVALLTGAALGTTLIPLLWVVTPLFAFADYPLRAEPYAIGISLVLLGLWLFYRSHKDLGLNWSMTLQVRENHSLVTEGIYTRIRHPMYSAMMLLGVAQVLFCPNWIAGPSYLVSFGALYIFRVRVEESMMLDRFGTEYEQYMQRTGRLIPPVWSGR